MSLEIKICGLTTPDAVETAVAVGADLVGFVFFPKSPRNLTVTSANTLATSARGRSLVTALAVDPDDDLVAAIVEGLRPDLLQLHGRETPARVGEIRTRSGVPVMKAVGIATAADVEAARAYLPVADRLLFDAKPPPTPEALPGGNGLAFDWRLVAGLDLAKPVMLSGGLDPANVGAAVELTGLGGVDVSSGVESAPGLKDPALIRAFVAAARAADRNRSGVTR